MKTPAKTSTLWKQLASAYEVDADGVLHYSVHFLETRSGKDFVISISGDGSANVGYFIGALMAFTHVWSTAANDLSDPETVAPATYH